MSGTVAKLEDEAIALMRKAAAGRMPVSAGLTGQLAHVVRDAYEAGERNVLEQVLGAWREYVGDENHEGHDDTDQFRDDLTGLMKAAGLL